MQIEKKNIFLKSSIGIAETRGNIKTAREILEKADEALYIAKQRGRNRIVGVENINAQKKIITLSAIGKNITWGVVIILLAVFLYSLKSRGVWHAFKSPQYYYVQLATGRYIEAWMIRDTSDSIVISFKRPGFITRLKSDFPAYDSLFFVPKSLILDFNLEKPSREGALPFGRILLKDRQKIESWILQEKEDALIVTFKDPVKPFYSKQAQLFDFSEPFVLPKKDVKTYIEYKK